MSKKQEYHLTEKEWLVIVAAVCEARDTLINDGYEANSYIAKQLAKADLLLMQCRRTKL